MVWCVCGFLPWPILLYYVVQELFGNILDWGYRFHRLKLHSLQLSSCLYPFVWLHALLDLRVFSFLVFVAHLYWWYSWIISWGLDFLLEFVHLSLDWRDWLALRYDLSLGSEYNWSHFGFGLINSLHGLPRLNFWESFYLLLRRINAVSCSFSCG